MLARVRTQIRRKRFSDRLRDNVQMTMEMAVTDGLTGLHNRRYLERHLGNRWSSRRWRAGSRCRCWCSTSTTSRRSTTITATPPATKCCANSRGGCASAVRGIDLACRMGGEEFVVAMPDTDAALALLVGERLRQKIAGEKFPVGETAAADAR